MYFTVGFAFYIFISMALIGLLPVWLRCVLYSKSKRLSLQVRIFFPTPPFLIYPNFALLPIRSWLSITCAFPHSQRAMEVTKHSRNTVQRESSKAHVHNLKIHIVLLRDLKRCIVSRRINPLTQRFEQLPSIFSAKFATRHRHNQRAQLCSNLRHLMLH